MPCDTVESLESLTLLCHSLYAMSFLAASDDKSSHQLRGSPETLLSEGEKRKWEMTFKQFNPK